MVSKRDIIHSLLSQVEISSASGDDTSMQVATLIEYSFANFPSPSTLPPDRLTAAARELDRIWSATNAEINSMLTNASDEMYPLYLFATVRGSTVAPSLFNTLRGAQIKARYKDVFDAWTRLNASNVF